MVKYLIGTNHIGIHAEENKANGLTSCANADFAIIWNKLEPDNLDKMLSRTGYVNYFYIIPVTWCIEV